MSDVIRKPHAAHALRQMITQFAVKVPTDERKRVRTRLCACFHEYLMDEASQSEALRTAMKMIHHPPCTSPAFVGELTVNRKFVAA